MKFYLHMYIFCIFIILYFSSSTAYVCIHDDYILEHDDHILYTVSHQSYKVNLQQHQEPATSSSPSLSSSSSSSSSSPLSASSYPNEDNTAPIRFHLDTIYLDEDPGFSCYYIGEIVKVNGNNYTCTKSDILTAEREEYIRRTLIPAARNIMQSLFSVMPVDGPLFLSGGRCGFQGGVTIPASYTKTGVGLYEVDLVVFVTCRPVLTPHVLAFAGQCQEDQIGRAIAGHLNINPSEVDVGEYAHEGQLGIIMHELTHVMGFSFGKFGNFHSPSSRTGYSYVANTALVKDQSESIAVINTPKVVEFVRQHFGCDNLQGAPLENGGGSGTKLSHWEKRTFMNEYMTGEATHNPVLSSLTLALFDDSGWYRVNYSHSLPLLWGKNRGCEFVEKSCDQWPTEGGYHCKASEDMCTFDMRAKGTCNMNTYGEELPIGNQYFSSSKRGGRDALADYCPYINPTSVWCDDETNTEIPSLIDSGETYCPTCRCFSSSLVKEFPFGGSKRLSCYKMECSGPSDMKVKVGKLWYTCEPNSTLTVEGYGGHIYCPSLLQIEAVCSNETGDTFPNWPHVKSITPEFGSPGSKVTITGSGFSQNVQSVVIHKECSNFTVLSDDVIIAILPDYDQLGNPAHLVAEKVNVVVIDKEGRTGLGINLFEIRASDDIRFYIHMVVWLISHWPAFLSILAAVGAAYYVRAARKRELQILLRSQSNINPDYD